MVTHASCYIRIIYSSIWMHEQNNGKHILWDHLRDLYEHTQADSGLFVGRRLTFEHLHMTAYSKMKVCLAAQVRVACRQLL